MTPVELTMTSILVPYWPKSKALAPGQVTSNPLRVRIVGASATIDEEVGLWD